MSEITVTFTEQEAEALVPWKGRTATVKEWNDRMDAAEDAHSKIRAALREARDEQPDEQERLV
jgi:hypothetical protein